ncbi:MAG: HPF/RaiA family ribosome-associated protein [Bacteriovorax sp.]|nr:HPF/RaiA family ribosome-associated protein [Bacteriovorax sp.]
MIQVKFKNLERSEMARDAAENRVALLIAKFPDLSTSKIQMTLEMENSPIQAGPDTFNVKLHVLGARYDGLTVEKKDSNLYVALADVIDHMLEVLNRFGDKARVKERTKSRKMAKKFEQTIDSF